MNLSRKFARREANRLRLLDPATKRLPKGTAFRRITKAVVPVPGMISYRHPTKGLRTRRITPQLFLSGFHAISKVA